MTRVNKVPLGGVPARRAIVRERPAAGAKDWNDAPLAAPERMESLGQEDDRATRRGRGHGGSGRDEQSRG